MSFALWLSFVLATVLIALSPGPGAAVSMSAGLRYGYLSALRAIAGLQSALLIQLGIVAGGLGALLLSSPWLFTVLKMCGALYLICLGVQKWRARPQALNAEELALEARGLFSQGVLVNLSNPKAIVFIAALVPQFIDANRPQGMQFLIMALTMCSVDTLVMSAYALLATRLRALLKNPEALCWQNRFFGMVFVLAGIFLAVAHA